MTSPLVSIVIPVYNGERFVADAIESALAQTYPHKEVIVIDDGSTDRTAEVLRGFGERIRFETGPNRGGSAARNRGVELARGELIQFLDADDLLHPEKLERQVPAVLERQAEVVCTGWQIRTFDGREIAPRCEIVGHADPVIAMLRGSVQTAAPLHWKSNFEKVGGFDEALPCSQERDLHLRMACAGMRFQSIEDVLLTWRKRVKSVSADSVKILRLRGRLLGRAHELLEERGTLTEERRFAIARLLANSARSLIGAGETETARNYLNEVNRIHPAALRSTYSGLARLLFDVSGPVTAQRLIGMKQRILGGRRRCREGPAAQ